MMISVCKYLFLLQVGAVTKGSIDKSQSIIEGPNQEKVAEPQVSQQQSPVPTFQQFGLNGATPVTYALPQGVILLQPQAFPIYPSAGHEVAIKVNSNSNSTSMIQTDAHQQSPTLTFNTAQQTPISGITQFQVNGKAQIASLTTDSVPPSQVSSISHTSAANSTQNNASPEQQDIPFELSGGASSLIEEGKAGRSMTEQQLAQFVAKNNAMGRYEREIQQEATNIQLEKERQENNKKKPKRCRGTRDECVDGEKAEFCRWDTNHGRCFFVCEKVKDEATCINSVTCGWHLLKCHDRKDVPFTWELQKEQGLWDEMSEVATFYPLMATRPADFVDTRNQDRHTTSVWWARLTRGGEIRFADEKPRMGVLGATASQRMKDLRLVGEGGLFRLCSLAPWSLDIDVEIQARMVACRIWRAYFVWMYTAIEKEFGYDGDWRKGKEQKQYFSWDRKLQQASEKDFYENGVTQSSEVLDTIYDDMDKYRFGLKERRAAIPDDALVRKTTRPIYANLVSIFGEIGNVGGILPPVKPWWETFGWYRVGKTDNYEQLNRVVDELISQIGHEPINNNQFKKVEHDLDPNLYKEGRRDVLSVENYRRMEKQRDIIQKLCPLVMLDPNQYQHWSFTSMMLEADLSKRTWNANEAPLACSLTQLIERIQAWEETNGASGIVNLLDPPKLRGDDEVYAKYDDSDSSSILSINVILAFVMF